MLNWICTLLLLMETSVDSLALFILFCSIIHIEESYALILKHCPCQRKVKLWLSSIVHLGGNKPTLQHHSCLDKVTMTLYHYSSWRKLSYYSVALLMSKKSKANFQHLYVVYWKLAYWHNQLGRKSSWLCSMQLTQYPTSSLMNPLAHCEE